MASAAGRTGKIRNLTLVLQRQQSTVPVEALRATLAHRLNQGTTDETASTATDTSMIRPGLMRSQSPR